VVEQLTRPVVDFARIARLWVRASMAYPASFLMLTVGSFVMTGLDFAAILIIFGRVDSVGGFGLDEVAFLYAGTGVGIAFGDFVVGRVERLGAMIRLGRLDTMMTKPVPLLVQVLADEFALRRVARIAQAGLVFAWAATKVSWDPGRVAVAAGMVVCGSLIFSGLFVTLASVQFWTADSAEAANAFTYGGNTLTQYPLTIYPSEVVKVLTFVVPVAFVNWYPSLYVLDRPDPFDLPGWLQFSSPVAAVLVLAVSALVWRTGVRHYRSTGS
jgi:ABC-2 type transport system permease protein